MNESILIILLILVIANIAISLFKKPKVDITHQLKDITDLMRRFDDTLVRTEKSIKDEFQRNREETNGIAMVEKELRKTLSKTLLGLD